LGMHRSATSLAAKGLYEAGIHMGRNLLGASPSNPYGHYEDLDFIRLNDRILHSAGGSWDNPPPEDAIVNAGKEMNKELPAFLKNKSEGGYFWGWKDPRTTLTIRAYMPHLQRYNPHFITCWRHPEQVAMSLATRDKFPKEKCVALAKTYNTRLLEFIKEWTNGYQL